MRALHRLSLLFLSLTVGLVNAAGAYPEYRVTVVAPAGSAARAINNAGVVVGTYPFSATATHGFLNRGAGLVDLGTLGGTASDAVAINDRGQVLGHWTSATAEQRGYIYRGGTQHDIGTIPGYGTTYTDINNRGFITAWGAPTGSFDAPHGFLRAPAGTFRDLGFLPDPNPMTQAFALNNHNKVVGASGEFSFPEQILHAFVWSRGVMRDIGDFGGTPNFAFDINDCGQITGYNSRKEDFHFKNAFLYSGGRLIDIDGRPSSEAPFSMGRGINCHGHVVGSSDHLSGFVYRGKRMQSLNALIDPALGWDIDSPEAINKAGQIAATATRAGLRYAVRLDLIRPMAVQTMQLELDEDAPPLAQEQAQAAADAKADAQAQAREVVRPVRQ